MKRTTYLPVPEFSEKAGVTSQAVYQRIKRGTLDKYIITDANGTTMVSLEAVERFTPRKTFQETFEPPRQREFVVEEDGDELESLTAHPESHESEIIGEPEETPNEILKQLTETIGTLERIIESQRVEIKEKTEALGEKDKLMAEYADKFAELAHKALQTASQAQTLHAVSESERINNGSCSGSEGVTDSDKTEETETSIEKESGKVSDTRHGFWSLFKRK